MNLNNMTDAEILDNLEEITCRNIIEMRRPELLRIIAGEKAVDVIPQCNQRFILRRDGIIDVGYMHGGKTIMVTQRAIQVLEEAP